MIHAFSFKDTNTQEETYYLLDVDGGAVHVLDGAAYQVALALEQGNPPDSIKGSAETQEILDEFYALEEAGLLCLCQTAEMSKQALRPAEEQIIKSMCLHVAHDCNLRCRYCFADTGEFQGERLLMPPEIGRAALDFLMAHAGKRKNLEVDLFGGEPLMNFNTVKEIVKYGRELEKKHDKIIHFTITTNGLALTDDTISFINAEMDNVVLSLDGRRNIHDEARPTVNGKGSYDAILPKALALVRARGEKEYYVRGTFTAKNLDFTQDVQALRDAGFEQISLEPVVLSKESPYAIQQEHVQRVLEEYDRLAAFQAESEKEGNWFNFFHFMIDLEDGPCLKKRIKGCGAGSEYVAVTPEGDIYPCHQFVGEKEFLLGNLSEGITNQTLRGQLAGSNIETKPACAACWAKYFCSGGCAANAWKFNKDLSQPEEMTCLFERKRVECALGLAMSEKLAKNA